MQDAHWLTQSEVMELEGRTRRWTQKHAEILGAVVVDRQKNGNPVHHYDLRRLSAPAQLKWARRQKVVPIDVGDDGGDEFMPWAQEEPAGGTGQLALALTRPAGSNLSDAERAQAEPRLLAIEPLIGKKNREQPLGKKALRQQVAKMNGVSERTLYSWEQRYLGTAGGAYEGMRGLPALVDHARADKGKPRLMNDAALDLLLHLTVPVDGLTGEMTIAEARRAYREERRLRDGYLQGVSRKGAKVVPKAAKGKSKAEAGEDQETPKTVPVRDQERLAKYLDAQGRLLEEARLPAVSYWTFRNWWRELPEASRRLGRKGREAYINEDAPVSYRDYLKLKPLDFVVMDHRQLDITCMMPAKQGPGKGWRLGRPWITAAIDMRTRKWLAWVVVEQPDSGSIAAVLKRLLLDHGLPKRFYWDNGQDFECDWLDGVLKSLGIKVTHSLVRRARSKMIEPNFKALASFERQTPWWCGHRPDARPERHEELVAEHNDWMAAGREEAVIRDSCSVTREEHKAPKRRPFLTLDEVREMYGLLMPDLNAQPHSGRGMETVTPEGTGRMSPAECWDGLIGGVVRRKVPTNTLLFLFREKRTVTVKHSQIKISHHGQPFIYEPAADADPLALLPFNEKKVEINLDRLDLQTIAVFYKGDFICLAQNMALRGMGAETFKEDEANRRRGHRLLRDLIQAAHGQVSVPGPVERLRRRAASREAVAESPEQRPEVTVAYPEAERAVAAAAGDGFRFSRSTARVESAVVEADPADSEFEFFN